MVMYLINDDIEFDELSGTLYSLTLKEERKILAPSSRLLKHLIDNQGEVISQKELFKIGWMDKEKFVTNNAFYQNILLIRKAFKELGCNYDAITTVPRKGYMLNENINYKMIALDPVDFGGENKDIASFTKEKNDIIKNKKGKIKAKKIYLFLFLFVILFFFLYFVFYTISNKKNQLYKYGMCGESSGKIVYCNLDNLKIDKNINYVKKLSGEVNEKYKYVYFTKYKYNDRSSYLFCIKKFSYFHFFKNDCVSFYILGNGIDK